MIGGGDQIYNDSVRVKGPLKEWTDIGNPQKRQKFPFDNEMRKRCDQYYYENYVRWYSTEPFATGNASIAQINIWDDHDIIDGFGSYSDHFMRCPVFRGNWWSQLQVLLLVSASYRPTRVHLHNRCPIDYACN